MADDIDDLLDECETKFFHSPNKPKQKPTSKNNSTTKKATRNDDKKLKRLAWSSIILALRSFPRSSKFIFLFFLTFYPR